MLTSWKTTLAGLGTVFAALGHFMVNASAGDFSSIAVDFMAISGGLGLVFAKDHDVTGGAVP